MTRRSTSDSALADSAEAPSSTASEASGSEGRSAFRNGLSRCTADPELLLSRHTSGWVGATSKLAPVVRSQRTLYSGTTTANGFDSRSPIGDRAREYRELNRRDNPRNGSGRRVAATTPTRRPSVDGNRKPGRVHAWGRGVQCRCGNAPPSRSDRPPHGGRERVGRGSLHYSLIQFP